MNEEAAVLTQAAVEWVKNDGVIAADTAMLLTTAGFNVEEFDEHMSIVTRQALKDLA